MSETSGYYPEIDPADVHVGDVIRINANDGSWAVQGKVDDIDLPHPRRDYQFRLNFGDYRRWHWAADARVHMVRRAELEPDPARVAEIQGLMDVAGLPTELRFRSDLAEHLVRNGVALLPETLTDEQAAMIGRGYGWSEGREVKSGHLAWPAIRAALIGGESDGR
jgi:hypothetical protein